MSTTCEGIGAAVDIGRLDEILGCHPADETSLIQALQDIQAEWSYLPRTALERVSEHCSVPLAKVYGVATFYRAFSLTPRGKYICKVCMGTACHIRGGRAIVDELSRVLGVKPGETTEDGKFTLETVNCVGACAMAPVVIVDAKYHGGVEPHQVEALVKEVGEDEN